MIKTLSQEDYEKIRNEFCHQNPGLTIYEVGDVSHPGISDMDFLVLDKAPFVSDNVFEFLQGGNILVIPSTTMPKVKYIEDFRLKLLQGESYTFASPPPHFKIIEILEWLPERICLLQFMNKTGIKNVTDRNMLLYFKSINRSIQNVLSMTGFKVSSPDTDYIRNNVDVIDFKNVTHQYIDSALECWDAFSSVHLPMRGKIKGSLKMNDYYCFSGKFDELLMYLHSMSRIECDLSKSLREKLTIDSHDYEIDDEFMSFAKERWEILNEVFVWFKKMQMSKGMIKYGWLLK